MARDLIRVVAAVIERDGCYLITQRNASAVLPLLWEFPGGRVESGETDEDALVREVEWRIGVKVQISGRLGEHTHEYHHYDVHMQMFGCKIPDDAEPASSNVNDMRWVTSAEMGNYEFPPADEGTMDRLLGLMRN